MYVCVHVCMCTCMCTMVKHNFDSSSEMSYINTYLLGVELHCNWILCTPSTDQIFTSLFLLLLFKSSNRYLNKNIGFINNTFATL